MEKSLIAAIDIGTTKIVAVTGRVIRDSKIEIISMASVPSLGVERGVVKNIEETSISIKKVLEELNKKVSSQFSEVWVGIAGQHVKSLQRSSQVQFEDDKHKITYEDIEGLLEKCINDNENEAEILVNLVPQSFELDNDVHTKSPIGKKSASLEANFLLTVSKSSALNNINKSLENNNLKSKELVLESLASAKSILSDEEVKKGVVLIDIGGGTSDLAIFHEGMVVHSAVIPFGGESITNDIMDAFSLEHRYAKELKHQYGSILGDKKNEQPIVIPNNEGSKIRIKQSDLTYVIKARVEEIIEMVDYQIELSGYADKVKSGFVLTGGGALLKDLPQTYSFFFSKYEVRIGVPRKHFFGGDLAKDFNTPIYATVTGLLLSGLEKNIYERNVVRKRVSNTSSDNNEAKIEGKANVFNKLRTRFGNLFKEEDSTFD